MEGVLVKLCILLSEKINAMNQNSEFLLSVWHFVVTAKMWDLHATHTNNILVAHGRAYGGSITPGSKPFYRGRS